jgi:NAD(P)-dependent dehydrogenase (short-subunit alcohol dehydrogenase family)
VANRAASASRPAHAEDADLCGAPANPYGYDFCCVAPSAVDRSTAHPGPWRDEAEGNDPEDAPYPVHRPIDIARSVVMLASPVTSTVNGTALVVDFGGLVLSSFEA